MVSNQQAIWTIIFLIIGELFLWVILSFSILLTTHVYIILGDAGFERAAKDAVEKAATCGMEINVECSNYRISLVDSNAYKEDASEVQYVWYLSGCILRCNL